MNGNPIPKTAQGEIINMSDHRSSQVRRASKPDADDIGNNIVPFAAKQADAAETAAKKSFTSEKLTWVNYLMMDARQEPLARLVGIAIAQTINEKTRDTFTPDRVIADRLGISARSVVAARLALRDGQWLAWHKPKPRGANRTKFVLAQKNIDAIDDHQTALKDRRDEEASTARSRRRR